MLKTFAFLVVGMLGVTSAHAIAVWPALKSEWGDVGARTGDGGLAGSFTVAGDLGKSGMHGTYSDEWAIVGVIAQAPYAHGAYICPYQIQCANRRKNKSTWTIYFRPNGWSFGHCATLCESGWTGEKCDVNLSGLPAYCDKTDYSSGGPFKSGISLRTWGGDTDMIEGWISGLDSWEQDYDGYRRECDTLIGVVKYLEHGVVAVPVIVCCDIDNWKSHDSWVRLVHRASGGKEKLLCASGYTANESKTDCVPIDPGWCETQDMVMCSGFERNLYDYKLHHIESSGTCVKYFCKEVGTAFTSVTDHTCTQCAGGTSRGGPSPVDGTCMVCDTGTVYDHDTRSCVNANAYSKTELQYGRGKTKNSTVGQQCWTVIAKEDYVVCVKSGGAKPSANSTTLSPNYSGRAARVPVRR